MLITKKRFKGSTYLNYCLPTITSLQGRDTFYRPRSYMNRYSSVADWLLLKHILTSSYTIK